MFGQVIGRDGNPRGRWHIVKDDAAPSKTGRKQTLCGQWAGTFSDRASGDPCATCDEASEAQAGPQAGGFRGWLATVLMDAARRLDPSIR